MFIPISFIIVILIAANLDNIQSRKVPKGKITLDEMNDMFHDDSNISERK